MKKCMNCMKDYAEEEKKCPYCGYTPGEGEQGGSFEGLPEASVLNERYIVGRAVSETEFSFVYQGWDALLLQRVCIKEYFPVKLARRGSDRCSLTFDSEEQKRDFEKGRLLFLRSGRILNENQEITGAVNVYRCFEENETAYMVSEYLAGITLEDFLAEKKKYSKIWADVLFLKVSQTLEQFQERNLLHLNLSPENIYLCGFEDYIDGNRLKADLEARPYEWESYDYGIRLLDFGEEKQEIYRRGAGSALLFDEGYMAPEQKLKGGGTGEWSDVYSLGILYYHLLFGELLPQNQIDEDGSILFKRRQEKMLSKTTCRFLKNALERDPDKRIHNIKQLLEEYRKGQLLEEGGSMKYSNCLLP